MIDKSTEPALRPRRLPARANPLGDLRGEADTRMLDAAFLDTAEFTTLTESVDRILVVGRRGAGKSALLYRLRRHWDALPHEKVITIAPDEAQVIATRPAAALLGDNYKSLRAGFRICWKYALLMEVVTLLRNHYKFQSSPAAAMLREEVANWLARGHDPLSRIRSTLRSLPAFPTPAEALGALAGELKLELVSQAVHQALEDTGEAFAILIDRLDEGYEPDSIGIGIVAGLVYAVSDLKTRYKSIRPALFLRDNIFRSLAKIDPDYSRDLEGQVIRLHWDAPELFYVVCKRLRVAFNLGLEQDRRVWNACTGSTLHEMDGFRQCLRLTLYRPRDILALLNEAFYKAARVNRSQITLEDVEATAKQISADRLDDLVKEYSAIIPSLVALVSAFAEGTPEFTLPIARRLLGPVLLAGDDDPIVQQDLFLHETVEDAVRSLYSIGFVGLRDNISGTFGFCHDGKSVDRGLTEGDTLLVHPCYWMALNLSKDVLAPQEAEEINDEYGIHILPAVPVVRREKIALVRNALVAVPLGKAGEAAFEDWGLRAIRLAFSGYLRNIQHHPNGAAPQRRDVVGSNFTDTPVWRMLRERYGVQQALFEIKNYPDLGPTEFRQMLSYLTGDYGRAGFFLTRAADVTIYKGAELDWIRELYDKHKVLAVKLSAAWLASLLERAAEPGKFDIVEAQLGKLIDNYLRLYVTGQGTPARRRGKRTHAHL